MKKAGHAHTTDADSGYHNLANRYLELLFRNDAETAHGAEEAVREGNRLCLKKGHIP
jgi:hypothetical protein